MSSSTDDIPIKAAGSYDFANADPETGKVDPMAKGYGAHVEEDLEARKKVEEEQPQSKQEGAKEQ